MTDEDKFEHDKQVAGYTSKLKAFSDGAVMLSALAILILAGRTSKYALPPQEAATVYELLHRADPSFSW